MPADGAPSAGSERAPEETSALVAQLVDGFAAAGFEVLRRHPVDGNLVLSPMSIGHALLMVRDAAEPETRAAIDATFAPPPGLAAHDAWKALDGAIQASSGTQIAADGTKTPVVSVADRLWPAIGTEPDRAWIDRLATHHGATVETIDVTDSEGARHRINEWIADRTNQLIPELLPRGFVHPGTTLVLTDAIYFKAQWRKVFGPPGPDEEPFVRLDGTTVDTRYLSHRSLRGLHGLGDGFVVADLAYLGDDHSMALIIPDHGRFDEVRRRLSAGFLTEVDTALGDGIFELRMPEWQTTTSIDLLGWLGERGIAPGHFPGVGPGFAIDGAIHGADITVDRFGTEAAAATAIGMRLSLPPEPEVTIAADRPFIYLIRHRPSGAVLFAGQVTDPTA